MPTTPSPVSWSKQELSQDTLPSPLAVGCLTKHCASHCATSDVCGASVSASVHSASVNTTDARQ